MSQPSVVAVKEETVTQIIVATFPSSTELTGVVNAACPSAKEKNMHIQNVHVYYIKDMCTIIICNGDYS